MIYEAEECRVYEGTLKAVVEQTVIFKKQGYQVKKVKRKIHWPFFWIHTYKVKISRPMIFDTETEEIIYTPISEL